MFVAKELRSTGTESGCSPRASTITGASSSADNPSALAIPGVPAYPRQHLLPDVRDTSDSPRTGSPSTAGLQVLHKLYKCYKCRARCQ